MYDEVLGKGVRPEKDTLWGGDEAAFGQGEDRQFLSCEWNSSPRRAQAARPVFAAAEVF